MKRCVFLTAFCLCLAALPVTAQDSPTALAEKQEAAERYKALSARLENLEEAVQAHQKRMNTLAEELRSMREEIVRLGNNNAVNAATQKSLENLAEAINKVDRARIADNEKVLTALDEIRKGLTERPSGGGRAASPAAVTPRPATERGYEYPVQPNDNPHVIASKLSKQGIKVTSKQIMDANPGVNWYRLKVGQKLFIPAPAP